MTAKVVTLAEAVKTLLEGATFTLTGITFSRPLYSVNLETVAGRNVLITPAEVEIAPSSRADTERKYRMFVVVQEKLSGSEDDQRAQVDALEELAEEIEDVLDGTKSLSSNDFVLTEWYPTLGSRRIFDPDNRLQRGLYLSFIEVSYTNI